MFFILLIYVKKYTIFVLKLYLLLIIISMNPTFIQLLHFYYIEFMTLISCRNYHKIMMMYETRKYPFYFKLLNFARTKLHINTLFIDKMIRNRNIKRIQMAYPMFSIYLNLCNLYKKPVRLSL